ncbi:error-prone DNA polymerase [Nocardioides luteus]|uniref:Error-prone DNA polymerase n=1 Tax=Nocardioides luteus TaxID=1844 RepID=A0ABQ5T293_9ACTN|nr:error-prone DNA polymerase [Nocardioides luteus]MDR7311547.1 error-prone DNA polymerase [Nocardioides luteus]GGR54841.1 error-prone DNA polymerase [Nocardioides luteus]GLJ70196.1 error-prone DNA polymerase [Nocardioides luteus]
MGWNNPGIPWKELERRLSGRPPRDPYGDAPISRRKKRLGDEEVHGPEGPVVPYAELHAHSDFSFLDGASSPSALVAEAIRQGLHGIAITDHDGFYGAPAFAEAAQKLASTSSTTDGQLRTIYGAELSLGLTKPQNGIADPEGSHLLVLARGVDGYRQLAGAITEAQLRGDEKGRPTYDLDELADRARGGDWLILTGCRKGTVRQALTSSGPIAAARELRALTDRFGHDNVVVELTDRGHPTDSYDNHMLADIAREVGLPTVATNNVHYATPERHRVADALAAVRARRTLGEIAGWLPAGPTAYVRSGEEMQHLFRRYPGAVERSVEIAEECAFDLRKATPRLPKRGIPETHTPASWLRHLTERGFAERYARAYASDPEFVERARERVEHELEVIERKDFPGYFVIVHDIVEYARSQKILCQGRGSAAASAVCYALGITAIDPVFYRLPFERFISEHREEEPDIDVDFDSDRREEVIQWVYRRYGRRNAAQVANIVGYRPKMAVRDAAKALGHSPGQQDAWSKHIGYSRVEAPEEIGVPAPVLALATEIHGAPRHLGIHSGGMVLTEEPIGEVVPIERARMEDRTVIQWDKDAAEYMGLVKFDLLGLGMLAALDHMMRLAAAHLDERWTLATMPKEEPAVYDMLCRADSIGVFQVESRAQIGTLPRLQPRCFYDLAIEIALIRPGPVQGGAVHPYVRRATGKDPVSYAHELLIPVLERTLGVPLFQEQLMEMGRVLGDFSVDDADLLRRAMGSKRGVERIDSLKEKLYRGMRAKGMTDTTAQAVYTQILSFANFGFAESHALSFAKLVYASSWFKLHYPAAFLAGLLRAQPMGFYSPQSLTQDARRHGVEVRRPDLLRSQAAADLEPLAEVELGTGPEVEPVEITGLDECLHDGEKTAWVPGTPDPTPVHRRDGNLAVRLGLDSVRGIGKDVAERIVKAREEAPFKDSLDLSRRAGLERAQLEALATAGCLEVFTSSRRQALWQAGWTESEDQLEGVRFTAEAPALPGLDPVEETLADLWATGVTPGSHPFAHLRAGLTAAGLPRIGDLPEAEAGRRITVAGLVTHRQRPGTAGGVTFINLEDETGMLNVICSAGLWRRHRKIAVSTSVMLIRGILERNDGVTNLVADRLAPLEEIHPEAARATSSRHRSRDFR